MTSYTIPYAHARSYYCGNGSHTSCILEITNGPEGQDVEWDRRGAPTVSDCQALGPATQWGRVGL